jgi:hypothetical protein
MTTTPAGLPPWSKTAAIEYYGGHVNKQNLLAQDATDPRTDVTAEQLMRLSADLASIVRVSAFCVMLVTCNDTSPAAPTVHYVRMMNGVDSDGYAGGSPPTGFPTLARTGTGAFTVTFAAEPEDDYGETEYLHLIGGIGGVSAAAEADVDIAASDPNTDTYNERVTVKVFNSSGALGDKTLLVELFT